YQFRSKSNTRKCSVENRFRLYTTTQESAQGIQWTWSCTILKASQSPLVAGISVQEYPDKNLCGAVSIDKQFHALTYNAGNHVITDEHCAQFDDDCAFASAGVLDP